MSSVRKHWPGWQRAITFFWPFGRSQWVTPTNAIVRRALAGPIALSDVTLEDLAKPVAPAPPAVAQAGPAPRASAPQRPGQAA
jgi:hypothetical protein